MQRVKTKLSVIFLTAHPAPNRLTLVHIRR